MVLKEIKIVKAEEAPRISTTKEGFDRIIFHYSERPPKEWLSFSSEEHDKVKSKEVIIETIEGYIIVQCKLRDLQEILDSLKVVSATTNVRYDLFLKEKQEKDKQQKEIYEKEKKKVEEAIDKLNFD